jgi:hypothetical protein
MIQRGWFLSQQVMEVICSLKKPPEHDARSTRLQGYNATRLRRSIHARHF